MGSVFLLSLTAVGMDVHEVRVEVDISPGLPGFHIVGLADIAVQESKDRIRSALTNSGFALPRGKITVNLAPAGIHKAGSSFDLPIALGILAAGDGELSKCLLRHGLFLSGELGLDGSIRPTQHTVLFADWAQEHQKSILVSSQSSTIISSSHGALYGEATIEGLLAALRTNTPTPLRSSCALTASPQFDVMLESIAGHKHAKRGLEIAAAGGHHALLWGSPGAGKTLLAHSLESILPPPTKEELREIRRIHSLRYSAGTEGLDISQRPFRNPHHSGSLVSLVGGGTLLRPGEISLAHRGILFLDEFAEFPRAHIESLRQPLQEQRIIIGRARYHCSLPAHFQLVATTNPCPCGYYGDTSTHCSCYETQRHKYISKLSGPILDRINMHLHIRRHSVRSLLSSANTESSEVVRARVQQARLFQSELPAANTPLTLRRIRSFGFSTSLVEEAADLAESSKLSARSLVKLLSLARTIASLEQCADVKRPHLDEAWSFKAPMNV